MSELAPVIGVIIAGGLSTRLGGRFKGNVRIGEFTLLERVVDRFRSQVDRVLLNLNEPADLRIDLTVVPDSVKGRPGPLAGLTAAFEYLEANKVAYGAVAAVPCDGPYLPEQLVNELAAAMLRESADVATVQYRGELQPTFSLWRRSAGPVVTAHLREKGDGGFRNLLRDLNAAIVEWPVSSLDPFFNINTPQDVAQARALAQEL